MTSSAITKESGSTFGNRRLAKDFEASIASAKVWVYIASVQLLIRRLVDTYTIYL